ncbi:MAG: rhomboid family intramembrane serine protease [Acidiferrobacter sp.]
MSYIVATDGLVYILSYVSRGSHLIAQLQFDPSLVMRGEVWRLITFIFVPPGSSIWVLFILYFYYLLGTRLEHEWGSFRFNVYYFTGMAATVLAAFLAGEGASATYLNLSLFLAFATIDPDFTILLFFVLPVKVKYLAWLSWLAVAFTVVVEPWPIKVMALVSIMNYFLFFGRDITARWKSRALAYPRRRAFNALSTQPQGAFVHKCTVCGMTEKDDALMDFRYCSQCNGHFEYCMPHLQAHEHRTD